MRKTEDDSEEADEDEDVEGDGGVGVLGRRSVWVPTSMTGIVSLQ